MKHHERMRILRSRYDSITRGDRASTAVCGRWTPGNNGWKHFRADMSAGFEPHLLLDRHDYHEPHGPDNSFWTREPRNLGRPVSRGPKDRQGIRNGRLKLIYYMGKHGKRKRTHWLALCDCGRLRTFSLDHLRRATCCGHCNTVRPEENEVLEPYYAGLYERDMLAIKAAMAEGFPMFSHGTPYPVTAPRTVEEPPAHFKPRSGVILANETWPQANTLTAREMAAIQARQNPGVSFL